MSLKFDHPDERRVNDLMRFMASMYIAFRRASKKYYWFLKNMRSNIHLIKRGIKRNWTVNLGLCPAGRTPEEFNYPCCWTLIQFSFTMLRAEKSQLAGRRLKPRKDKKQPRFRITPHTSTSVVSPWGDSSTLFLSLRGFTRAAGCAPKTENRSWDC